MTDTPAEPKKAEPVLIANPLLDDPYTWDGCTVQLMVTLLPDDHAVGGREFVIAARTHKDTPQIVSGRSVSLCAGNYDYLLEQINSLLTIMQEEMPQRKLEHMREEAAKPAVKKTPLPATENKTVVAQASFVKASGKKVAQVGPDLFSFKQD